MLFANSVVVSAELGAALTAFGDGDYGAAMTQYRPLTDSVNRDAQ
ncbi:MAG: hypothetical protein VCB07_09075 [Gammaproteobacteria bacterium]